MSETFLSDAQSAPDVTESVSLKEVALVFLKLGTIAFGGPAAHIAMMEDEFVTRRPWLSRQQFFDRLAAANLIPGPSLKIPHPVRRWGTTLPPGAPGERVSSFFICCAGASSPRGGFAA